MILSYMLLVFITLNIKHDFKLLSFILYVPFTRTQCCWHAHTKQKKPSPATQPADQRFPALTYYYLYSQMYYLHSALSKCCSNRFPTTLSSLSSFLFQWTHSIGKRYPDPSYSDTWMTVPEQKQCRTSLQVKNWYLVLFKTINFISFILHELLKNIWSFTHCCWILFKTPIGV